MEPYISVMKEAMARKGCLATVLLYSCSNSHTKRNDRLRQFIETNKSIEKILRHNEMN